ncbi:MAG: trypsin-like serine protease [bacterium]
MKKSFSYMLVIFIITLIFIFNNLNINANDNKKDKINIVYGDNADIKDYPWQVALFTVDTSNNIEYQICGGSIIDTYWILTAAHCVVGETYRTRKIAVEITSLSDAQLGQILDISDIIIHPDYNDSTLQNDIALLRLSYPVDTSKLGASVIRILAPDEELNGLIDPGTVGTITGWGVIQDDMWDQPDTLQVAEVSIISISQANEWLDETEPLGIRVSEGMLPTGKEQGGPDACRGDSGGPLAVKDSTGNWVLAGITSWGYHCAAPKNPNVYTRVPYYYNFIMDNTKIGMNINPIQSDNVEIINLELEDTICTCKPEIYFGNVFIRNFGINSLESFLLTVKVGFNKDYLIDSVNSLISFNKSLPSKGSKHIDIEKKFTLDTGKYYFEVTVSNPNGHNVPLENSTSSGTFALIVPDTAKLIFNFKGMYDDQRWTLTKYPFQRAIAFGYYNTGNSYKEIKEKLCLTPGQYRMELEGGNNGEYSILMYNNGLEYLTEKSELMYMNYSRFSIPFIPEYALSIYLGISYGRDSVFLCNDQHPEEEGVVYLINDGSLFASNVKIQYTFNGANKDTTFEYLRPRSGFIYSTDLNNLNFGKNNIKAEIVNYNNIQEEKTPEDNVFEKSFYVIPSPKVINIEIPPIESYGYYFYLRDWKDDIVLYGDFDEDEGYYNDLCLPPGCYTIFPYDWDGVGMERDTAAIIRDNEGKILFVIKGCDFVPSKPVRFCIPTTNVDDELSQYFLVYPNPANDKLTIQFPRNHSNVIFITIYNSQGMELKNFVVNKNLNNGLVYIDISSYYSGLYFIKFQYGENFTFQKFIICR